MSAPVPLFVNGAQAGGVIEEPPQVAEPGLVTLPCDQPNCSETFTGPRAGRGSAPFLLGKHRWSKHKVKSDRAKKAAAGNTRKAGAPTAEDHEESPIAAAVRSTAVEAGAGRKAGVPTGDDLGNGLGRGLGLATLSIASWVVETDPNIPDTPEGNAQRSALVDYLALSDSAARGIMHPIGRMVAPTELNRRYGRAVVDNVDVIASVADLAMFFAHWRQYMRMRRLAQPAPTIDVQPAFPPPTVVPFPPGGQDGPPAGVVLSAADVARLQAQREEHPNG